MRIIKAHSHGHSVLKWWYGLSGAVPGQLRGQCPETVAGAIRTGFETQNSRKPAQTGQNGVAAEVREMVDRTRESASWEVQKCAGKHFCRDERNSLGQTESPLTFRMFWQN